MPADFDKNRNDVMTKGGLLSISSYIATLQFLDFVKGIVHSYWSMLATLLLTRTRHIMMYEVLL